MRGEYERQHVIMRQHYLTHGRPQNRQLKHCLVIQCDRQVTAPGQHTSTALGSQSRPNPIWTPPPSPPVPPSRAARPAPACCSSGGGEGAAAGRRRRAGGGGCRGGVVISSSAASKLVVLYGPCRCLCAGPCTGIRRDVIDGTTTYGRGHRRDTATARTCFQRQGLRNLPATADQVDVPHLRLGDGSCAWVPSANKSAASRTPNSSTPSRDTASRATSPRLLR